MYDTTKYSRDAQGNILAIYDRKNDSVWLKEWDIYGAKRIGVVDTTMLVGTLPVTCVCTQPPNLIDSSSISYLEGQKQYELTNHLGNVLVTLSDKKLPVDTTGTPNIANYYVACIVNAQDYYPFGMVEPGRQYSLYRGDSLYRFAFNGKLHDDDIYGKDNSYDYGMRFYDPRLGRFMSVDPLFKKFPMLSTYQYASDNPIWYVDLDGLEGTNPDNYAGAPDLPPDGPYGQKGKDWTPLETGDAWDAMNKGNGQMNGKVYYDAGMNEGKGGYLAQKPTEVTTTTTVETKVTDVECTHYDTKKLIPGRKAEKHKVPVTKTETKTVTKTETKQ